MYFVQKASIDRKYKRKVDKSVDTSGRRYNVMMEEDGDGGSGSFTMLSLLNNSCERIIN